MDNSAENFLKRHQISGSDIMYMIREEGKTAVHMVDGRIFSTFLPLKSIRAFLPVEQFFNINKGVVVAVSQIMDIEDGIYTMVDGRQFRGRQRDCAQHKRNRQRLNRHMYTVPHFMPQNLAEKFVVMDKLPLPFCVVELVFDENGHGADFVFRYCNKHLEDMVSMPTEEILGKSYFEVFRSSDRKCLVTYADVALNGTSRTMIDKNPATGNEHTLYCYQPEPGYCACLIVI